MDSPLWVKDKKQILRAIEVLIDEAQFWRQMGVNINSTILDNARVAWLELGRSKQEGDSHGS